MKNNFKLITLLCCLTCSQWLSAQSLNTVNYTFTKAIGTYNNVSSATALNDGENIPIGFPFYHYGIRFDTLYATMEGYVGLKSDVNNCGSTLGAFVAFCNVDPNFGDSGIKYKLTGSAGSRVLVIEWRNVGIDFPGTANNDDYVNFQIALFEGSNKIEYRYGPQVITDLNADLQGYDGPQVYHEISSFLTFQTRNMWLYFGAASPSVLTDFTGADDNIVGAPANGTIYRFIPSAVTGVEQISKNTFRVFPNPANNRLSIDFCNLSQTSHLLIQDYTGKELLSEALTSDQKLITLDCTEWDTGIYFISIHTCNGIITKKITKL